MLVFWKLKPAQRAKLIQYQYKNYGLKLEVASQVPPWEEKPNIEIPVNIEMDEDELREFMAEPPHGQRKVE